MDVQNTEICKIQDRCTELKQWIEDNAMECLMDEKHLQEGSRERGYWAHGYQTALLDVLRLFGRERFLRMISNDPNSNRFAA
jgi:hypothetical protein